MEALNFLLKRQRFRKFRTFRDPSSISLEKKERFGRRFIEYGLLGLIVFSPLPAASVPEWSILVIQLAALAMMAAYFMLKTPPKTSNLLLQSLKVPGLLFAGFFLFLIVQIIPWPLFIVKVLSPGAYGFQRAYAPNFAGMKFLSFSLLPSHTLQEALEILSYFFIGFLIVKTVTRFSQIKKLYLAIIGMGVFEALFGLFQLFQKNPSLLFYKKAYNLDSATGTFVNRNHFSGYLELIVPLAIGLIIARIDVFALSGKRWREKLISFSRKEFSFNLIMTMCIFVMSVAIIVSKSRSGMFLLALMFLLFLELTILFLSRMGGRQIWVRNFLKLTFGFITLFSLYVGISASIQRFALDNLLHEGRPVYWNNMKGMIARFPLMGTGLGTFAEVYPAYEKVGIKGTLDHAHNDYLEYLSELGLLGMGLLLGGILLIALKSFSMWKKRNNPEIKGMGMGGLIALILMAIHSVSDFNLQIPANMLLFSIILSLTIVVVHHGKA
jgi:O-antigen ligase